MKLLEIVQLLKKKYRLEIVREIIKKFNIAIGDIKPNKNEMHYPVKHDNQLFCIECLFRKYYTSKKLPRLLSLQYM